jgi:hypothetical protein
MIPLHSLPGLAVLALSFSTFAQQAPLRFLPEQPASPALTPGDAGAVEVIAITYDVATGTLRDRRTIAPGAEALGVPPCFDNSDVPLGFQPFSPFSVADVGTELLDWGIKRCDQRGLVRAVTFAYRSTASDPVQGGPGAALSVAVFSDTRGFNRVGNELFRATLSGLPGRGAPPGPDVLDAGDAPIVFLTIDFGDVPLVLPDGRIGWSYLQLDGRTGPLLIRAPSTFNGTEDALDVFFPGPISAGNYTGTFNFGTCCPFGSLWFQVAEFDAGRPRTAIVDGTGVNPSILREVLPARLGDTWAGHIDISLHPTTMLTLLFSSRAGLAPTATPFGELLIDPAQRLGRALVGFGFYLVPVPMRASLLGSTLHMQAALLTDVGASSLAPILTNALRVTAGF